MTQVHIPSCVNHSRIVSAKGGELRIGTFIGSMWRAGDACHEYEGSTSGAYKHVEDGRHGNGGVDRDALGSEGFCDSDFAAMLCIEAEGQTCYEG